MSFSRKDMAEHLLRLKDNAHWRHYVEMLESTFNEKTMALLNSDHPDEALRGECRAYSKLLRDINLTSGSPT